MARSDKPSKLTNFLTVVTRNTETDKQQVASLRGNISGAGRGAQRSAVCRLWQPLRLPVLWAPLPLLTTPTARGMPRAEGGLLGPAQSPCLGLPGGGDAPPCSLGKAVTSAECPTGPAKAPERSKALPRVDRHQECLRHPEVSWDAWRSNTWCDLMAGSKVSWLQDCPVPQRATATQSWSPVGQEYPASLNSGSLSKSETRVDQTLGPSEQDIPGH